MPKPKITIRKVKSPDKWGDHTYYDWVVAYGKQGKIFYGYRRNPKAVEKEARDFYNNLKAMVS